MANNMLPGWSIEIKNLTGTANLDAILKHMLTKSPLTISVGLDDPDEPTMVQCAVERCNVRSAGEDGELTYDVVFSGIDQGEATGGK